MGKLFFHIIVLLYLQVTCLPCFMMQKDHQIKLIINI